MSPYDKRLIERARYLRKNMTPAEKYLWSKINRTQLGCWFYSQKIIGIFIVDFYCPKAKLIIEIDGNQHFSKEAIEYDKERSHYFKSIKRKTIRFTNKEVLINVDAVIERIRKNLMNSPSCPSFSKGGMKIEDNQR